MWRQRREPFAGVLGPPKTLNPLYFWEKEGNTIGLQGRLLSLAQMGLIFITFKLGMITCALPTVCCYQNIKLSMKMK